MSLFLDIRGTTEPIVSSFTLFWRISINDPLNEPLLYSSWLSWRILWRDRTKAKRPGVQRTGTKRLLWRFQIHSCQIHKRRAIFRLMAINTSGKPQHSANLDFNESKVFSFFTCRQQPLFLTLTWHMHRSVIYYCIAARTAVLYAQSEAEYNGVAACVTIQGSTLWLVRKLCPPVRASNHTPCCTATLLWPKW